MPKRAAKKTVVKKKQTLQSTPRSGPRQLVAPKRIWYKPLTWRYSPPVPSYKPLPKARVLLGKTLGHLWANKKIFGGIVLLYGLLNLVLVRGLGGSSDLTALKSGLDTVLHGFTGALTSSLATYAALLASSGSGNTQTSSIYQGVLFLVCSLAFIWALRQSLAGRIVRVRDSFYRGMYPLVPFVLLFLLMGVQLVPLAAGNGLYSAVVHYGIAVHPWERLLWVAITIVLSLWSLRMVTASIFALYIVTLPGMTPLRAYRSARQLVYGRRLLLWRKLIFLPIVLLVIATLIELPLILLLTPLAVWTFFAISMLALPIVHGYLYNLYREML